jgi:hypothetical protein
MARRWWREERIARQWWRVEDGATVVERGEDSAAEDAVNKRLHVENGGFIGDRPQSI